MKKIFLMLAFTGIVGASSATSISILFKGHASIINNGGDKDKDKKGKKKSCTSAEGEKKSCCKKTGKTCTKGETPKAEEKK